MCVYACVHVYMHIYSLLQERGTSVRPALKVAVQHIGGHLMVSGMHMDISG